MELFAISNKKQVSNQSVLNRYLFFYHRINTRTSFSYS